MLNKLKAYFTKEGLKIGVGIFVALALVLSIAQNIHYFLAYNTSIDALLVCATKSNQNIPNFTGKADLENAIKDSEDNKPSKSTTAKKVIDDLIQQASKYGISKEMLLIELKAKID